MFKSVFCDIIFAMNRKIDYKINENDTGKTVEGFLKERGYTHQVLVRLKQTDHGILRNGIWAYTNERLCKDDLITVQIVENECSDNIAPVNLPLDIAYEDDDIIVINSSLFLYLYYTTNPCNSQLRQRGRREIYQIWGTITNRKYLALRLSTEAWYITDSARTRHI